MPRLSCISVLILAPLLLLAGSAEATIRYASNTGIGASPCTVNTTAVAMCNTVTALGAAVGDDIVKILGNTPQSPSVYQGANYMFVPPSGISGTAGHLITAKCVDSSGNDNDGACVFDGQFVRRPFLLDANAYWNIIGVNVKNSSRSGIGVQNNSSNVLLQRMVVWDANGAYNASTVSVTSNDVTLEDFAAFGMGRYVYSGAQGSNNFTCRRCWARWEGNLNVGPKLGYQLTYNGYGFTCENCLATWTAQMMPSAYTLLNNGIVYDTNPTLAGVQSQRYTNGIDQRVGQFRSHGEDGTNKCAQMELLGSLAYSGPFTDTWRSPLVGASINVSNSTYAADCNTIRDVYLYYDPSSANAGSVAGFSLNKGTATLTQSTADHITSVTSSGDVFQTGWVITNRVTSTTIAGAPNLWTNTGSGARLCFKTINGTTTTTPLWPWPMNERIKQATGQSGNYWNNGGPGCSASTGNCTGIPTASRSVTDVTADLESIFGTLPAECRTDSATPPFSAFSGFPQTSVISTFSGGPVAPPTGFSTLTGGGWTESGGVASPTVAFSTIKANTLYDADQEAYCTLSSIPGNDEGLNTFAIQFLVTDSSNRYKIALNRVSGTNNDSISIIRRIAGTDATLSTTNLGFDAVVGDAVGVRVDDGVITAAYKRVSDGIWLVIATGDVGLSPPTTGYIGMGGTTTSACTEFGGGNLNTAPGDTTAPTAPSSLTVSVSSATSVDLSWTASTDAVGVTAYRIYRGEQSNCSDCVQVGVNTTNAFTDAAPPPGVTRYYRVTALDAAQNESTASNISAGRVPDGPAYAGGSGRER